jgi:exodeoxyribonuclease-3
VSRLRLLSYNIRYGGVGKEAAIAAVIRRAAPDVVLLQEATNPGVVERIAELAGMAQWGTSRRQSLGYVAAAPVRHAEWHQPRVSRHAFLELVPAEGDMRLYGVHLSAVHAAWTERRRVAEVRALLRTVAARAAGFHVLAGDFNTLAPGELLEVGRLPFRLRPFVWLSGGHIRWRTIQQVLDAGYCDVFRQASPGETGFSFPTWQPHLRLDYAFVPATYAHHVRAAEVIQDDPAPTASDHFPLLAEFAQ